MTWPPLTSKTQLGDSVVTLILHEVFRILSNVGVACLNILKPEESKVVVVIDKKVVQFSPIDAT